MASQVCTRSPRWANTNPSKHPLYKQVASHIGIVRSQYMGPNSLTDPFKGVMIVMGAYEVRHDVNLQSHQTGLRANLGSAGCKG